jgi:hypothetical protein
MHSRHGGALEVLVCRFDPPVKQSHEVLHGPFRPRSAYD